MPLTEQLAAGQMDTTRLPSLMALGIKLVVFDMAGTTVDEHGLVYETLKSVLRAEGLSFTEEEFNKWHGANKKEVIQFFAGREARDDADIDRIADTFETQLNAKYEDPATPISLYPGTLVLFDTMRAAGIKVALDTGYPRKLADVLINRLGLAPHIDGSATSCEVGKGRPYPYMIHRLLRECGLTSVREVAKVGDTVRDIEEGINAGCSVVIGVLSGADGREELEKAGASAVIPNVTHLKVGSVGDSLPSVDAARGRKRAAAEMGKGVEQQEQAPAKMARV